MMLNADIVTLFVLNLHFFIPSRGSRTTRLLVSDDGVAIKKILKELLTFFRTLQMNKIKFESSPADSAIYHIEIGNSTLLGLLNQKLFQFPV